MSRKHFAGLDRSKQLNFHSFPERGFIQELSLTPKQFQPAWLIQVFIETGTVHNGHKHKPFQFRVKETMHALKGPFQQQTQAAMLPFCSPKTWLIKITTQTNYMCKRKTQVTTQMLNFFVSNQQKSSEIEEKSVFTLTRKQYLKKPFLIFRPFFCFFLFRFWRVQNCKQRCVRWTHTVSSKLTSTLAEVHRCTSWRPQSTCETVENTDVSRKHFCFCLPAAGQVRF